jgi:hypothetical protein
MTVYEALVVVSQGNYQDIPECRAKKNLLLWSSEKAKEVLEKYHSDPLNSTLTKWVNQDITSLDFCP